MSEWRANRRWRGNFGLIVARSLAAVAIAAILVAASLWLMGPSRGGSETERALLPRDTAFTGATQLSYDVDDGPFFCPPPVRGGGGCLAWVSTTYGVDNPEATQADLARWLSAGGWEPEIDYEGRNEPYEWSDGDASYRDDVTFRTLKVRWYEEDGARMLLLAVGMVEG